MRIFVFPVLLLSTVAFLPLGVLTQRTDRLKRPHSRIVGGTEAGTYLSSHVAHLIVSYSDADHTGLCTATILAPRWLLTAAHCLVGPHGLVTAVSASTYAFIGEQDATLRLHNTDKTPFWLRSFFIHRRYRPGTADHRNDIAMLYLNRVIPPGTYRTVDLSQTLPPYGIAVNAAGYGALGAHMPRSSRFMKANLLLKPFAICAQQEHVYFQQYLSADVQICAVSVGWPEVGKTDTCYGDSGGPLFLLDPVTKHLQQYGITSFGTSECAAPGSVAWYTRVGGYVKDVKMAIRGNSSFWRKFS